MAIDGQTGRKPRRGLLHPTRQASEAFDILAAEIAPVASEELVAANSRQDDLDVPAGEFRDQIGGDEGSIRQRLVHVPDELGKQRYDIGLDKDFMMLGTEQLGHTSGIGQLVVKR